MNCTAFKTEPGYPGLTREIEHKPGDMRLCGYVVVPPDHPCAGKYYDDLNAHIGLSVEITYGRKTPNGDWMFGFDTSWYYDGPRGSENYRDFAYVKDKCEDLARGLKKMETEGCPEDVETREEALGK